MKSIRQSFSVPFDYSVHFTEGIFRAENVLLKNIIREDEGAELKKVLVIVDKGLLDKRPELMADIISYFSGMANPVLCERPLVVSGGEEVKNNNIWLGELLNAIHAHGLCRQSWVIAIGGGAVLDLVGFAAALAHRGIRHIRIPGTVLSQNDSGIGVKNGINAFGKKNFLGTFTPPIAVINDFEFLNTLEDRDWRSGIAEAVKVAMIKDEDFFSFIQQNSEGLAQRNMELMKLLIYRCARLHLDHIASCNDPFEKGSSRPLDFGHWAAHKLEQLTDYRLRHGEAVAIGIAIDTTYARMKGIIEEEHWMDVLILLKQLGFCLFIPEMKDRSDQLIEGLDEFREHLGGRLTIMLPERPGKGCEVNEVDRKIMRQAVLMLYKFEAMAGV